ncbi:hypothetical protein L207DRAFT_512043 [Hyaloscypha variabilis F]|uniref:Uncharacterized protein n=1 Tax=Hyaloscypha variabilis (strain UAMH 11265 / GT02V1 / F) TaxID=1149755 RepID=A0A2J6RPY6_HYAVF|nr:hypothetical protein L207DRAFT_512043 [Hyaloscypha variabilis F]
MALRLKRIPTEQQTSYAVYAQKGTFTLLSTLCTPYYTASSSTSLPSLPVPPTSSTQPPEPQHHRPPRAALQLAHPRETPKARHQHQIQRLLLNRSKVVYLPGRKHDSG